MNTQEKLLLTTLIENGGSLALLQGVEPKQLETLSAYASDRLKQGKVDEALSLFTLLTRVDSWCPSHWIYLGLCYQQRQEHEEALFCFAQAGTLHISNPYPAYYACISFQALGNLSKAQEAKEAALKWCAKKTEYASLKKIIEQIHIAEDK